MVGEDMPEISTRLLESVTGSITSGRTSRRDDRGRNPLFGSTGQIGATDLVEFSGPSILVARVGANAGSVYQVDGQYGVSDNTLVIRPAADQNVDFLTEVLRHANLNRMVYGSGQPLVTGTMLKSLEIPDLPLASQRRIAVALGDADVLLATLERLIVKKQAVKQGMLQQFFDKGTRAPVGESGAREEREDQQLGNLLLRPPRYGINAAAVPLTAATPTYIRITDIDDSGRFSPKVGVDHPKSADYLLDQGELVFARTGASVGKSYLCDPHDGELVYAGFLINIAPDPRVLNPAYLALFAQTKRYWDWVARTSVRSGQPGINGREFSQLPVYAPEIEEQNFIASTVSDIDAEIAVLGRRLDKARLIKTGMMQELLTGRTRLTVQGGQ
ncbi:restriction endonuclease subunit S [Streptomyces sp. NPDC059271]|uniref:restriction endonuclease subunit S n=1 Tax=Streptomyces sp. NPDC059271 TaxID=3346799 RepID=UPI00367F7DE8